MFEWNVLLDLSWMATTPSFGTLHLKLALQVLCESRWIGSVWVVQGCEGVGDIPGVRGVQGSLQVLRN